MNVCAKLKSRTNIIQKLVGSTWGSSASTLRTSSLALVYSTAEYCCPVWSHSSHVKMVDTTLNHCLRTITGTIKSTPVPWLSVLANILPPHIRRDAALAREMKKINENLKLPIHRDLADRRGTRLVSRKPLCIKAEAIDYSTYSAEAEWKRHWNDLDLTNSELIDDPNVKLLGFDLARQTWSQLNRIRSNHGRCNSMLHRWDPGIPSACDCGDASQTIHHIVNDCPNRKITGGLPNLFKLDESGIEWLNDLDITL